MTDWSLISVRFTLYIVLATLFGLAAFSLYGLRADERADAIGLRPWLLGGVIIGLLFSIGWLVIMASSMAGTLPWPIDRAAIGALLDGSPIGFAWKVRIVALVLAGIAARLPNSRGPWVAAVVTMSGVALATLAWTGHGAADDGAAGWLHLAADILHLVAAGIWSGALLGLLLLVARPATRVDAAQLGLIHRALHRFSAVGTMVVATIVVTGLVNAWLLVGIGHLAMLATTLYGQLLIAKLVLFAAMLALAALNRFRLTPAFQRSIAAQDHRGALSALRRSLGVETGCIVAVFAIVAWLGTLQPPMSVM